MRTLLLALAATFFLASAAHAAPVDEADIAALISERGGHTSAGVKIAGDWAVADEIVTDSEGPRKIAVAVLHRENGHWDLTGELTGAGTPTAEALAYHVVDDSAAARLVDGATRDEQKPIVTLLHQTKPAGYPPGVLLETIAVAGNWAICAYRSRASLRKSDEMHQALLRRTGGAWHLVEDGGATLDLAPYGVPMNLRRALLGRR